MEAGAVLGFEEESQVDVPGWSLDGQVGECRVHRGRGWFSLEGGRGGRGRAWLVLDASTKEPQQDEEGQGQTFLEPTGQVGWVVGLRVWYPSGGGRA